ncbi:MAG: tetratricopeptide repeat protein, partial [Chthoniobacterales bacterium]
GEAVAALEDYSSSLRFDPNLGGVLSRRGRLYLQQNDLDNAISDFSEAIRAEPGTDSASSYACRALAYERKGNLDAALVDFESALRLNQQIGWIYLEQGKLYQRQRRLPEALADYSAAIRLKPGNKTFLQARAKADQAAHHPEEELADLTAILRIDPRDDFALRARALALAAKGDAKNALPAFDDWIRYTQSSKARESRSRFLAKQGDFGLIARDLRQEIAAGGRVDPSLRPRLAWLLATCPDPAIRDGREAVAEATKACDDADWKDFSALDTLAAAYAEEGHFAEAERFERQALGIARWFSDKGGAQKRLALYQKGLPYHETPPPKRTAGRE